jgi:hypothetical protein
MHLNCEIVFDAFERPRALIDVDTSLATALTDALSYYRLPFVITELEVSDVLRLREIDAVSESVHALSVANGIGVLRLSLADCEVLDAAVEVYLRERDLESYQSPEKRARLALLNEFASPLVQLILDLRAPTAVLI